jgi:hypothetical protein
LTRLRWIPFIILLAALGSLAAALVVASDYRRHEETAGLSAEYHAGVSWNAPVWRTVEAVPHSRALWARAAQLSTPAFSVRWRGYLAIPATATYRFIARGKPAVLVIDGRPAADGDSPFGGAPLRLNRGLHRIQIDYAFVSGPEDFRIAWAARAGPFVPLDRILLSAEIINADTVRHRRLLHAAGRWMPLPLLACLAAACVFGVRRAIRRFFAPLPASPRSRLALRLILVGAAVLFATGSWWGQPAFVDWAPDEVSPDEVLEAVRTRFAGGWTTNYPPLHLAVLAAFDAPFFITAAAGLPSIDDVRVRGMVVVVNRLVSAAMGIGILFFVYRLCAEYRKPRAGIAAAAFATAVLPLTYYAKTANVDVPCHFWFMLALVFLMRALRGRAPGDFYAFTLAGMAAVCTKDQAYGYFILPAVAIAWLAFAPGRAQSTAEPRPRTVLIMAGLVVACVLVLDGALWNPSGFVEHFRMMAGPASEPFRTYPPTLSGHGRMAMDAFSELGRMLSWPIFAIAVAGVVWAIRCRERGLLMLLLAPVSYYVTLISVIGYHYDRFFIGVALILCAFAGWAADRALAAEGPRRALVKIAICATIAYAVARVAALDALMIRDSRYGAEAWLRQNVAPGSMVAAAGRDLYLPRHVMVAHDTIRARIADLGASHPDYVVLNAGYALREPGSNDARFYQALREGREGYTLRAAFRTSIPFSPLALEPRFRDVVDDPYSNLSKINPLIEVYGR